MVGLRKLRIVPGKLLQFALRKRHCESGCCRT